MSLDSPRLIGPYEVRATIARGGMAAVYKAHQGSLDRTVALKVISAHLAAEPEFMERFRQEALAIARLSHPNIVTVHDFGDDGGVPYLVMEYVEGQTLGDLLIHGLSSQEIGHLAGQVAAGLDYAHSRGIVHRDIKPQNVLVTPEGRAVLADFGLARLMESARRLTMSGGVVGTPEYMSPEQAAGRPTDHRTDIYALGVILYEMLGGLRPFTAETPLGVLMKHLQEPPPPLRELRRDLPQAVEDVISTALAKRPEDRYQTAGDLVRAYRLAIEPAGAELVASTPSAAGSTAGASQPLAAPVGSGASAARAAPPELDLSKYAGLKMTAERATRPHETPSLAQLRTPVGGWPPSGQAEGGTGGPGTARQTPSAPPPGTRVCPACQALISPGESTCPACLYIVPFEQVTSKPHRKGLERTEVRVNLLPYGLRWDPTGLERARGLAQSKVAELAAQGWELVLPLDAAGTFTQGRSAAGPMVQGAVLRLQRAV